MVWRIVSRLSFFALIGLAPLDALADAGGNTAGRDHALIIGIDDYRGGWPRLDNAVNDARSIAETLGGLGFSVNVQTNVTGEELHRLLLEFFVIKGADPEARLLLWFAGHGETIDGEGYLVPVDAPISARPEFLLNAMPMRMLGSFVRLAQAKHVLAVFDSCFAGTIFESRAAPSARTRARIDEPVRAFLTSGDAGQRVRDDGSFKDLFIRAITRDVEADFNADGMVTGAELGLFLSQEVTAVTQLTQTPQYGKLHDTRFNRGDFYFRVAPESSSPPPTADRETLFWESIKWSTEAVEYEAYLARFPNGFYSELAAGRVARLKDEERAQTTLVRPVWPLDQTMTVAGRSAVNLRRSPDQTSDRVSSLEPGMTVSVTGKTADAPWFRVRLPDGTTGFILASYLQADGKGGDAAVHGAPLIRATFGPPVSETLTIPVDASRNEIRHTAYLKNGAIVWFDGDIYGDEIGLSIYVDTPNDAVAPTFRHVLDTSRPSTTRLANLTPEPIKTWGLPEPEYSTLSAEIEFVLSK